MTPNKNVHMRGFDWMCPSEIRGGGEKSGRGERAAGPQCRVSGLCGLCGLPKAEHGQLAQCKHHQQATSRLGRVMPTACYACTGPGARRALCWARPFYTCPPSVPRFDDARLRQRPLAAPPAAAPHRGEARRGEERSTSSERRLGTPITFALQFAHTHTAVPHSLESTGAATPVTIS